MLHVEQLCDWKTHPPILSTSYWKIWEGVSLEKSFEHVFKKVYPYMLTAIK